MPNNQYDLKQADPDLFYALRGEWHRQVETIELIASENYVSESVLLAQGSILTNKYAEGYPGRRYYGGCAYVDIAEQLAIERAKKLFNAKFANVQPHSGAQANQAAFLALLQPGDCILGMSLAAGGHLTHGAPPSLSGKWFQAIGYGVHTKTHLIDYDQVEALAQEHKPRLIIAGGSAYGRIIDFARFRQIADQVGAYLLVDMAHFAGLVAGGIYPSPFPHAHIVTTTTHKTLRGPRAGMILTNDEELAKRVNRAVFPGLQGGPLMHIIAAKAVALGEALQPSFKTYAAQIVKNAQVMAKALEQKGLKIITHGTDSHLFLVDLRPKKVTGQIAEQVLEKAGLTCNKNAIPFDPEKPVITSGIRIGTAAITTRGFDENACIQVADWINKVLETAVQNPSEIETVTNKIADDIQQFLKDYPLYQSILY